MGKNDWESDTAEQIAERVLQSLDRGLIYEGEPFDRARLLKMLEQGLSISGHQFDDIVLDAFRDAGSELSDAQIVHLVSIRDQVLIALLRRLRS